MAILKVPYNGEWAIIESPSAVKFTEQTLTAAEKAQARENIGVTDITVDVAFSATSTNPVQNKVVNAAITNLNGLVGDIAVSTQISTAIASKANTSALISHTGNTSNPHNVTKSQVGLGNVENKSSATIRGELTKANVTDALGYTPPQTDTVYTHPSHTAKSSGLYKITVDGAGHVSGATAVTKSDITALGIPAQDTTYSAATTSVNGLMTTDMVTKLNGIATGATKITVDSALSSSSTNPVQNKVVNSAISNLNTLVGDTAVSTQITNAIASKQNTITGGATTIASSNLTASRALVSDGNGKVAVSAVTSTELGYLDGVTSAIQTQLDGKAASSHTHSYAASSHNHAASNITSGTLAVARGGTGVTSNPSMLTNLGSTSAASVFAASPRPGVTGTLGVGNGGTGATTAAAARTNLGIGNVGTLTYTEVAF